MDFNKIWYQQCSFIAADYALRLISKYLRVVRVVGVKFLFLAPIIGCNAKVRNILFRAICAYYIYFMVLRGSQ